MGLIDDWLARGTHYELLGHRIFVVDVAPASERAEPVLVLHGFPTSSIDWHLALDPIVTAGRRVVALDLLGYGFSAKPDQRYSLFEQADIVAALAQTLDLGTVALVTHDMGDSVGGEVLARSIDGTLPFEIERRVLTNGSIYIEMAHLTDGQKLLSSLPDERIESGGAPQEALELALRNTFAPDAKVADEEVAAMAAAIVRDGGNALLPRIIRYLDERRQHERRWTGAIERHPAPLDVIWGDLDPIAVWPMVERLHGERPDATVHRLDGVGHYPMVEAPARFNDALLAALTK